MIYLQDSDFTLYQGDALEVLRTLPDESVHMCVTSPPFYGLRDYGTGTWEGGDAECDHSLERATAQAEREKFSQRTPEQKALRRETGGNVGAFRSARYVAQDEINRDTCGKCGATRIDRQIGLEETPEQWVQKLVEVFREVQRVLRRDGTLWLEVGDSYGSGRGAGVDDGQTTHERVDTKGTVKGFVPNSWGGGNIGAAAHPYKPKDLIGAPWLLAFALRADGWYLRSDIVWSRPNPMPESVTDRPTKSHSYVFLLSKSARYFFDQEAVREPHNDPEHIARYGDRYKTRWLPASDRVVNNNRAYCGGDPVAGRNIRSVWEIPTQPYPDAHFATYPEELVRRCILAGTSERGCCPECGGPWVRETSVEQIAKARNVDPVKYGEGRNSEQGGSWSASYAEQTRKLATTLGWHPSCECVGLDDVFHPPLPCTVLDPFSGSGTTGLVARKHGRKSIGIELSESYCALTARRLQQLSLLAEA